MRMKSIQRGLWVWTQAEALYPCFESSSGGSATELQTDSPLSGMGPMLAIRLAGLVRISCRSE